jgi:hypothetical protein
MIGKCSIPAITISQSVTTIMAPDTSEQEKIIAFDSIYPNLTSDMGSCQVLLLTLQSPAGSIRSSSVRAITEKLLNAKSCEERCQWLDQVLNSFFTRRDHTPEDSELFLMMERMIRQYRHEMPHVFLRLSQEIRKGIRGKSSPALYKALPHFHEEACRDTTFRSTITLKRINDTRIRNVLLSKEINPLDLTGTLESIHSRSLGETDFEIIAYHIAAISGSHDLSSIKAALKNLGHWGEKFGGQDLFDFPRFLAILQQYRAGSADLPPEVQNQIGMQIFLTGSLIENIKKNAGSIHYRDTIPEFLHALSHMGNVRDFIESICDLLETPGLPKALYSPALDLLGKILTSLTKDRSPKEKTQRLIYTEDVFTADERIRKTLISLMYRPDVPQDIRNSALSLFIVSRPKNLNEELKKIFISLNADDPLLTFGLETLATLHYLPALDTVISVIQTIRTRGGNAEYGVKVLEKLGHSDAAKELVSFMDEPGDGMQESSRESLIRSGYSDNVRYIETGRLIKSQYRTLTEIKDHISQQENRLREVNFQICTEDCAYRHMVYIINRFLLNHEIACCELNTKLMVEEDQKMIQRIIVDEIINAARSVEPELPRALAQNTNGGDSDEMYATLYNDILSRNNHLREAIKDPQNSIRELNVEIQEIGNNRPLPPADDVLERDKLVKDYESQVKEQKYRLDFLNKELHTFTSAMRIWESRINQVSSGLGPAMNRATRGRSHSHQLHITDTNSAIREIQVSIRQIETIEQREQDLRNRILKSTEDATRTLGDLERETKKHRDRIVELATQRASIKKDLEDSQIASQKLQQSLNEEKKNLDLLQKRREHQNALSDNVARQRSEFWSDKKRLEDESKRYLECTVERVVEERFNPDYQETFDFFRKRLQKSGLR